MRVPQARQTKKIADQMVVTWGCDGRHFDGAALRAERPARGCSGDSSRPALNMSALVDVLPGTWLSSRLGCRPDRGRWFPEGDRHGGRFGSCWPRLAGGGE